jgi:cytochrome P450
MGWPTVDIDRTTSRLGENFILCSPSSNQIVTCYPPAVEHITKDHKNWPQPGAQSQLFAFYGQNVSSTNGEEWKRHRKITASAFNENSMHDVWDEAIKQASKLNFAAETDRTLGRIRTTFDILAMHVLAVVGFGGDSLLDSVPSGHHMSLMQCLGFILKHIMLTLIFNGLKAPNFLLPKVLQELKMSVAEFRLYMEEQVLRHMQVSNHNTNPTSLLGRIVSANEAEKQQLQKSEARPSYLTESELYGNLFVFNLAGYETTASSFTFALSYLAAHPEAQDYIFEEVEKHYTSSIDRDYSTVYPKLVRCQALMYESLRLAAPAPLLVRSPTTPQELPIVTDGEQTTLTIHPGTLVGMHFYGAHLSPRWGSNASSFSPKRFVSSSAGTESVTVPENVLFFPWILGPRVCPGKKFSQVEFVAIMAQILSEYCVQPLKEAGETERAARERLMNVIDEKYFNVSAHLRRPEDAGIRFVRRAI